jgi:hypothetical protein
MIKLAGVVRVVFYTAITIVLLNLNLFGLDKATREYSAVLFNLIVGPAYTSYQTHGAKRADQALPAHYRCGEDGTVENGNGDVAPCMPAVLTLTEHGLNERLNGRWPISYRDHAFILGRLLEGNPRALVVDILFLDDRPKETIDPLREQVAAYAAAGVPLYFAALSYTDLADGLRHPKNWCSSDDAVRPTCLTGEPVRSEHIIWVDIGDGAMDPDARARGGSYFLNYPTRVTQEASGRSLAGPAFKIYNDLRVGAGSAYRGPELPPDDVYADVPMRLFWAGEPHDLTRKYYDCDPARGMVARALQAILTPNELRQRCPTLPAARADYLLSTDEEGATFWKTRAQIAEFVEGRVVYYAADLSAFGDQIVAPGLGRVPGVWAHAKAHDNLLRFGDDYKRSEISVLDFPVDVTVVEYLFVLVFVIVATAMFPMVKLRNTRENGNRPGYFCRFVDKFTETDLSQLCPEIRSLLRYPLYWFVCSLLLLALTWTCFHYCNLHPINWVQLLGLFSVIGAVAAQRPFERSVAVLHSLMNPPASNDHQDPKPPNGDAPTST